MGTKTLNCFSVRAQPFRQVMIIALKLFLIK